jgi:hypothetical protein
MRWPDSTGPPVNEGERKYTDSGKASWAGLPGWFGPVFFSSFFYFFLFLFSFKTFAKEFQIKPNKFLKFFNIQSNKLGQ